MNIILLGSNYFQKSLNELGVNAAWAGTDAECEIQLPHPDFDVPEMLRQINWNPDVILLTDDLGRRVMPGGLDRVDILKVYYAVDGPINEYWQQHLAPLFDLVLADQKSTARRLDQVCPGRVQWLPVAVDTVQYLGPAEDRQYDISFVGTVSDNVRPKRSRILENLSGRYNVKIAGDRDEGWVMPREASSIYRQSALVLNENLFNGVTTRMLEAMASGGLLLTEKDQEGLSDLFDIGEDLEVFGPDDLLAKIDACLADPDRCRRMAAKGRDKVLQSHDIHHRAVRLLELIQQARPGSGLTDPVDIAACLGQALFLVAFRWPKPLGWQRLMRADKLLTEVKGQGRKDGRLFFFQAMIAKQRKAWDEARHGFEAALEAGDVRGGLALAYLYLERDRPDEAQQVMEKIMSGEQFEFPGRTARNLNANQHLAIGRMLEAKGHDLTPGFSFYEHDTSLWNAFEHYRAALEIQPDHIDAVTALARVLGRYDAWTEADIFLRQGLEHHPHDPRLTELAREASVKGYGALGE